MDSTSYRRKYSKYRSYNKNRKNKKDNRKNKDKFVENVKKQIITCAVIFLIIYGLKNINTPFTKYVTGKIDDTLSYTMNVNDTYKSIETFAENIGIKNENNKNLDQKNIEDQNDIEKVDINSDILMSEDLPINDINNTNKAKSTNVDLVNTEGNVIIRQEIMAPVEGTVTSKFGYRKHPLYKKNIFHKGIDIDAPKGSDIVSAMSGVVVEVSSNDSYGKYVKIGHEDDIYTFYAHCDEILVKKGDAVKKGDKIAKVGGSGAVLGVHLHFEIRKNDKPLDPLNYIKLPVLLSDNEI